MLAPQALPSQDGSQGRKCARFRCTRSCALPALQRASWERLKPASVYPVSVRVSGAWFSSRPTPLGMKTAAQGQVEEPGRVASRRMQPLRMSRLTSAQSTYCTAWQSVDWENRASATMHSLMSHRLLKQHGTYNTVQHQRVTLLLGDFRAPPWDGPRVENRPTHHGARHCSRTTGGNVPARTRVVRWRHTSGRMAVRPRVILETTLQP